ncbi:MAG: C39 family peptidase [Patescibacteria group bacterium]|jgi:hypothetical protein
MRKYLVNITIIFLVLAFLGLAKVALVTEADDSPNNLSSPEKAPYIPEVRPGASETESAPVEVRGNNGDVLAEKEVKGSGTTDTRKVLEAVPFLSQAPFGDWKDERQQDGCEEASAVMAMLWVKGEAGVTKDYALSKILDISQFEEKQYDSYHDNGAKETADRIFNGYFKYKNVEVKYDVSLEDIKKALSEGYLVIAPMDGQKLDNPNYTGGGPERHMLVIKGYDPVKKQFITNDPGTRKGESYRYEENHFYDSIRDYIAGNHVPITEVRKNVIIVKK